MKITRVVHFRKSAYDLYIGRPSLWENPFTVEEHGRGTAIDLFEEYLKDNLRTGVWTEDMLLGLDGKVLGCWCAPRPCHGNVLVKYINLIKMYRRLGQSYTQTLINKQ